jgi:hypothetical protein
MVTVHYKFRSTTASDAEFERHGFDLSRPLTTKSGNYAIIISTNGPGPSPIIGIVYGSHSKSITGNMHRWDMHGKSYVGYACSKSVAHEDLVKNAVGEFDWDRPFRTRDGRKARIICTDRLGERPYLCLVRMANREMPILYYPDGKTDYNKSERSLDLVNY